MAKKNPWQGKHREFGNFVKTQGISFAQVVNFLILKLKDIVIFAAKNSIFFLKAGLVCQVSFVYILVTNYVNWHRENLRLDRENTGNLRIQFEWVPCKRYGKLMIGVEGINHGMIKVEGVWVDGWGGGGEEGVCSFSPVWLMVVQGM